MQDGVGPPGAPAGGGVGVGAAERGQRLGAGRGRRAARRRGRRGRAARPAPPSTGRCRGRRAAPGRPPRGRRRGRGRRRRRPARRPARAPCGRRAPVSPTADRSASARAAARGKAWVRLPTGSASGRARRGHHPRGEGAGAGDRDLLAEHRADGELVGVGGGRHPPSGAPRRPARRAPGRRRARRRRRPGRRPGRACRRQRVTADAEVAQLGQPQPGDHRRAAAGGGGELDDRRAVRQVEDAGERRPVPLLEAGDGVRAEEEQHLVGGVGRAGGQPEGQPAGGAAVAAGRRLRRSADGRRREHLAHGVVELPDAGEAGREGDVGHRQHRWSR